MSTSGKRGCAAAGVVTMSLITLVTLPARGRLSELDTAYVLGARAKVDF